MIKFQATATIHLITPVIEVPSKTGGQGFQKRELILDDSWVDRDHQSHPNFVVIEFSGERMAQLDSFFPGQRVTVDVMLTGREYNGRIFNSLRGLSVALYQQPQAVPAPVYAQQPQYQQAPPAPQPAAIPGYAQQPTAPTYPPQQTYAPAPSYPGADDLPFAH